MKIWWGYDGDCMGIWCNNTITPKNIDPENSWFLDERNFPNQVFLQPPIYLVGSISLFGGWSFTPCHKIEVWICNFSASFRRLLSTITSGHTNANDMQWSCQTTYIYIYIHTYINITIKYTKTWRCRASQGQISTRACTHRPRRCMPMLKREARMVEKSSKMQREFMLFDMFQLKRNKNETTFLFSFPQNLSQYP